MRKLKKTSLHLGKYDIEWDNETIEVYEIFLVDGKEIKRVLIFKK